MPDACTICPYREICENNGIYIDECSNLDFNDPDFENLIYGKHHGEDEWGEVSYRKYTEGILDYGDLSDINEDDAN